jgi:uncharacterized delta-60 repeat protein
VLLLAPAGAIAAPGDLNAGFGSGGIASLPAGTELNAITIAPDGSIVAVGASGSSILVVRLSAAGAVLASWSGAPGVANAVAVQPDGKVVVAGEDSAGMLVERFNVDGTPDSGFGTAGIVHAVAGGAANAVALGPNGTIVAAGETVAPAVTGNTYKVIALLRLSSAGAPDTSLGPGGTKIVNAGEDSVANGLAVQEDGKMLIAGSQGPGEHQVVNALVARLNPDGSPDASFAGGGFYLYYHPGGGGASVFNAVALGPGGGIIAAGGDSQATPQALFVRLTCGGTPYAGFPATFPSAHFFSGAPVGANAVAVAAGGQVIGAGHYQDSGQPSVGLWGAALSGAPSLFTADPAGAEGRGMAIDSQGNVIVAADNLQVGGDQAINGFVASYQGLGPAPAAGPSVCGYTPASSPTTPPTPTESAPTVSLAAASGLSSTGAVLSGSVNPGGQATTLHFDYGRSTAYGSSTPVAQLPPGTAAAPVTSVLSGLAPDTVYHFRLVAQNASGTSASPDMTFRTASAPRPARPLLLSAQTVYVSAHGSAAVLVGCGAAPRCRGALALTRRGTTLSEAHPPSITVPAGGSAVLQVPLTPAARILLARDHGQLSGVGMTITGSRSVVPETLRALTGRGAPRRLLVGAQTALVSPSGSAALLLGCSGSRRCSGSVALSLGRVVLASMTHASAKSGAAAVAHLTLTRSAQRLLARHHGRLSGVRLLVKPPSGRGTTATVTLRAEGAGG